MRKFRKSTKITIKFLKQKLNLENNFSLYNKVENCKRLVETFFNLNKLKNLKKLKKLWNVKKRSIFFNKPRPIAKGKFFPLFRVQFKLCSALCIICIFAFYIKIISSIYANLYAKQLRSFSWALEIFLSLKIPTCSLIRGK